MYVSCCKMARRKTYHGKSSANSINSVRTKFKLNLTKAKAKNPFPISLTLQIYCKDPNREKTTFKVVEVSRVRRSRRRRENLLRINKNDHD